MATTRRPTDIELTGITPATRKQRKLYVWYDARDGLVHIAVHPKRKRGWSIRLTPAEFERIKNF